MMRTVPFVAAILAASVLTGCAAEPTKEERVARHWKRQEYLSTVPTCTAREECEQKWSAAQNWVIKNAGWKIQTATDSIIETYNGRTGSTSLSIRVRREPVTGGGYRFLVTTWCANTYRCDMDELSAGISFNKTLNDLTPDQ